MGDVDGDDAILEIYVRYVYKSCKSYRTFSITKFCNVITNDRRRITIMSLLIIVREYLRINAILYQYNNYHCIILLYAII